MASANSVSLHLFSLPHRIRRHFFLKALPLPEGALCPFGTSLIFLTVLISSSIILKNTTYLSISSVTSKIYHKPQQFQER